MVIAIAILRNYKGETEMTNLEFYKDEIIKQIKKLYDDPEYTSYGQAFCAAICRLYMKDKKTPFYGVYYEQVLDWLLAEHQEPIKLKKWEYDLLKCYQETKDDGEFVDHYILKEMQYKGYFQNIDYNLTIEEILENCEVEYE